MGPIETLLLDVDGTLLDTREFILAAFEHSLARHGLVVPGRQELAARVGEPLEDIYLSLGGELSSALAAAHRGFQVENLHLAQPYPGARETLEELRAAGIRLAAVTSRSRRTSLITLELAGLAAYFSAVVSAEDAPALKPHPAPLHRALELLGAGPATAVMVGDTSHDIAAGRAAGVSTIGVRYGFDRDIAAAGPDAIVDDVRELPGLIMGEGRIGGRRLAGR